MYWDALMVGAYMFTVIVSSSLVDHLIIMQCPALSFLMVFIPKPILSHMSITTATFL